MAGLSLTLDPMGKMFQNASSLKPLGQLKPNCPGMIIERSSVFLCRSEIQDGCHHRSQYHRCQPLRFFRNCYEFRAKITVLRSTVYLLRISDYCRPETFPHLNIIVIIQTLHCMLKWCNDKRLRDFDYLILQGFSGLSIVENNLSISCLIPSS